MKKIILAALALLSISTAALAQRTLSLEECVQLARDNNRALKNAALDVSMADEQQREAYTKYFPEVSAQAMAFYCFDKLIKGDGIIPNEIAALGDNFAALAGQSFSYSELNRAYSATLSVMQPIYAGGQITTGNKLAAIGKEVAQLQRELKEKDVEQRVTDNYWQIATVKYNLQTLDAADKQIAEAEKSTTDYLDAGLTTRNDLLKVQLRKQELASDRLKLDNAGHVLRLLLAQMIGLPGEDVDIAIDTLDAQDPATFFVQSNEAVLTRQELALAQKGVEAQQLEVKNERGKNLPTVAVGVVGLHTGFGGLSDDAKNYANSSITNAMLMGTVSVPISSWWGGKHAIRRQKMKLQQAQNDALEAREQLQIDIESAWSNLTEAYKQVEIARKSVEQAEENLRMVNDQYRAGTTDLNELLDAETLRRKACSSLSTALCTYQNACTAYRLKTR